ncbi:WbqC family protein [Parabacteroides sp. PF5-6]|uniref:WbqC family protein n=1 Tax=Parabacteroides sp. PF5-6 TaxID=1742403 RepID=UPI0024051BF4|nr:WbqC family protein [Parabacteroides sp. PF5-6]MDF9831586.1 hypothetical protein [Parabacteroides sp. PF5-6]
MRLAIYQSYFFPYIGYFQLMQAVDKFILYDYLHYIDGGWIARNRIMSPDGHTFYMYIPIEKKSSNRRINELVISHHEDWQQKVAGQLRSCYGKAPFFQQLFPWVEDLLMQPCDRLSAFNYKSLTAIARLLDIPTEIVWDHTLYQAIEERLETENYPLEKKSQRPLWICRQEKADTFVNAIGGQKLYSKAIFAEQGVELFFLQSDKYMRQEPDNVPMPELSILDVLFRYGVEETKRLLHCYTLI